MKKNVIAGNWKMNKTNSEGVAFINELKSIDTTGFSGQKLIFAPTIMLQELLNETKGTDIAIGVQNIHQNEEGAFTGETSIKMVKSLGINYVLVGHSERRQYFNESDKIVNTKTKLVLENDLKAVVCVGETLEERKAEITNSILNTQVTNGLDGIEEADMKDIIIAYEPVWAIGTGLVASAEDANEACKYIRSVIKDMYNSEVAEAVVIQYGGSVTPDSVNELISQTDIDGALVGGASLDATSYSKLLV